VFLLALLGRLLLVASGMVMAAPVLLATSQREAVMESGVLSLETTMDMEMLLKYKKLLNLSR
jgi:hypothetical protein